MLQKSHDFMDTCKLDKKLSESDFEKWTDHWGKLPEKLDYASATEAIAHELAHIYFVSGFFEPMESSLDYLEDKVRRWLNCQFEDNENIAVDEQYKIQDYDEIRSLAVGILVSEMFRDPPSDIHKLISYAIQDNLYTKTYRGEKSFNKVIDYMNSDEAKNIAIQLFDYMNRCRY